MEKIVESLMIYELQQPSATFLKTHTFPSAPNFLLLAKPSNLFFFLPAPAAAIFFRLRRKGVRRNYFDRLPGLFRNHTDRAGYDVVPWFLQGEMWVDLS